MNSVSVCVKSTCSCLKSNALTFGQTFLINSVEQTVLNFLEVRYKRIHSAFSEWLRKALQNASWASLTIRLIPNTLHTLSVLKLPLLAWYRTRFTTVDHTGSIKRCCWGSLRAWKATVHSRCRWLTAKSWAIGHTVCQMARFGMHVRSSATTTQGSNGRHWKYSNCYCRYKGQILRDKCNNLLCSIDTGSHCHKCRTLAVRHKGCPCQKVLTINTGRSTYTTREHTTCELVFD